MSAFLGPIHYWLYNKIQLQEAWICDILTVAAKMDWQAVSEERLDAACGKPELQPLEEIIDGRNIHGWLHQRIATSEARLAFLVTGLLKENASRLEDLKQAAFLFGKNHALLSGISADDALKALEDTLLDGMPCDRVNRVTERGEDRALWQKTQCVHRVYWDEAGGDISIYDALRHQIIVGMLVDTGLEFHAGENSTYAISRKGHDHV